MEENRGPIPSTSNQSASADPEPWKLLGRDTPAGKALFKLYNGDNAGKSVGKQYHQRNKEQHDRKIANGWNPKDIEPPKPEYKRPEISYPKFGGPKGSSQSLNAARLNAIPRRKPADVIIREIEQEQRQAREALPPMPRGPLLDDKEKDRLVELMHFRGKVPQATLEQREEAARHRGARPNKPITEREELQALFDSVMDEVEERRAFLAEMQTNGGLKKDHVHQIHAEIQVRVDDMKKIDRMIQALGPEK